MSRKSGLACESAILLSVLVGLGMFLVPRATSTIWTDSAWTAWMAPIANRIHDRQKLYTDGCRLPIPPLSPLLLYWSTHRATWLSESIACQVCGSVSLFLMFLGLHLLGARTPLPLLATLAAIPLHFSWLKLILYDELPFVWVAASLVCGVMLLRLIQQAGPELRPTWKIRLWTIALGATVALCVFSKQNVGAGLAVGATAFVLAMPGSLKSRSQAVGVYSIGFTIAAGLLLLVCAPHMSMRGFWNDVFLTSAEVKGGNRLMLKILAHIAIQLAVLAGCALIPLAFAWGTGPARSLHFAASSLHARLRHPFGRTVSLGQWLSLVIPATLAALAACLVETSRRFVDVFAQESQLVAVAVGGAYLVLLWIAAAGVWQARSATPSIGPLSFLLLPGMFLFALSGGRWLCNTTGLVWLEGCLPKFVCPDVGYVLGFALIFGVFLGLAKARRDSSLLKRAVAPTLTFALMFALWSPLHARLAAARECREKWPEVAFLKGVRVQASSNGMRSLVETVRRLAPSHSDQVLLLPEDPNVLEWFQRPRPSFSSAIVYFDQYWDRYVDADFVKLTSNPPKVIVIGPTEGLSWGAGMFGPEHDSRGTTRLLRRVSDELIPTRYVLAGTQFINPGQQRNGVCIYQLRPPATDEQPTEPPTPTLPRTTAAMR